jgi:FeS assembly SUF system protein
MNPTPAEIGMSRLTGQREEPASAPSVPETARPLPLPLTAEQVEDMRKAVINELHQCFDPEIPVNIYELGLIYGLDVQSDGSVKIQMTLTSPACPVAGSLPGEVKARVARLANTTAVTVDVVWDPPWDKSRMTEAAKLQLGIDD